MIDQVYKWVHNNFFTKRELWNGVLNLKYLVLSGMSGGQTVYGGTDANDDLTLDSTSDSTKGYVMLQSGGGNVGINTTNVTHALTIGTPETPVVSSAKMAVYVATGAYAIFRSTDNDIEALVGADSNGAIVGAMTSSALQLRTNNSTRIHVTSGGSVGVGHTSPSYGLDVLSGAGSQNIARFGQSGVSNGLTVTSNGSSLTISISGVIGEAWNNLTYNTGWETFSGSFNPAQYKKVGDLVFVRGLVKRTSGTETIIGTLPSGYRPNLTNIFSCTTYDNVWGEARVDSSGNIVFITGDVTWFSLDGIMLSTV